MQAYHSTTHSILKNQVLIYCLCSLEKIVFRAYTAFMPCDKDGRFPLRLQIIQD